MSDHFPAGKRKGKSVPWQSFANCIKLILYFDYFHPLRDNGGHSMDVRAPRGDATVGRRACRVTLAKLMSQHTSGNRNVQAVTPAARGRLIRWLLIAMAVGAGGWGLWRGRFEDRPEPDSPVPHANALADDDQASIATAERALAALPPLEPTPASPTDLMPLSAGDGVLSRQAARVAAARARLVAGEAKEELNDLGLAETEDAGYVVREARQAERRKNLDALLRLADRASERGDWIATAAATASVLKYEPANTHAAALRDRAIQGIDTLVDRYVALQHEPARLAERKADATQIRRGARGGDPLCQCAVVLYSRDDPTLEEAPDTFIRYRVEGWPGVLRRAGRGSRTAAFLAARCYEAGIGVERDMAVALRWYRDAAERGRLQAQNNLAWIYHQGFGGVPQDRDEAVTWYRLAARQGSVPAQCSLAGLLLDGDRGETADAEAVAWYRLAAEHGSALAQCNLALLLMTGRGVTRDEPRAATLFQAAAAQDDTLAQFNLGYLYMTGKGVMQDDVEAVRWYRLAAEKGFAAAQRNLGGMHAVGRGVPRNDAEAAKWYQLAAEQGDAGAQCNIGWMYARGLGVDQDRVKAVNWYRQSAERGNPEGLFMLGVLTVQGVGTVRDEEQGRRWIAEAAARGLEQARAWLEPAGRQPLPELP